MVLVGVCVTVGLFVGVLVSVLVAVLVGVLVLVGVFVAVGVLVWVGVFVSVGELRLVGVRVAVRVRVGTLVFVAVGQKDEMQRVGVATANTTGFPDHWGPCAETWASTELLDPRNPTLITKNAMNKAADRARILLDLDAWIGDMRCIMLSRD